MGIYKGIDVSLWQKNINFNAVKASGIDFVIINAGYGHSIHQKDPYFEQNYGRAKAAGLNVGAYWYSYADSPLPENNLITRFTLTLKKRANLSKEQTFVLNWLKHFVQRLKAMATMLDSIFHDHRYKTIFLLMLLVVMLCGLPNIIPVSTTAETAGFGNTLLMVQSPGLAVTLT